MESGYLLGIDVGTTTTKAAVYDPAKGQVVAVASRATKTHHPQPGWSEVDQA
ncbi:MAG: FGGY family carbohydrate kinase, partial [Chloroflexota bacterium]